MATTPTPRSYSDILGNLLDGFLSRQGIRSVKVGGPVLSIFESTSQSQLRNSNDIFTLLGSSTLDQATGTALDRLGQDEGVFRDTESPSTGKVNIADSSFTKISTKLFQGVSAPIIGSMTIYVADASSFTASGQLYIGRGTSNFEGPVSYASVASVGNYWQINLSSPTQRFHNLGEAVTLSQGGDRLVNAGSIVQTPLGNISGSVQFKVLYAATIPDGETSLLNVPVIALKPGVSGNVASSAISSFSSPPFTGATVTNPTPFTNGTSAENDDTYRGRIRAARQSRARGTALALQTFTVGITATDENKKVLSSSVVSHLNSPTTLYIDDGTGYEEKTAGVAIESLVDSALGGEQFFKVAQQPPIAKAFALSGDSAPFFLSSGMELAFSVGGLPPTVHTFDADEFRFVNNATVYEVIASINGDPSLNWSARIANNSTQISVFAKADTQESIQVVSTIGNDANSIFLFPTNRIDTMRLYKNDKLLVKDGALASITSNSFSSWGSPVSGDTLILQVDGTPVGGSVGEQGYYKFVNQDFVNAGTAFTTVGKNTVSTWVAVLNYKIPGITASEVNGEIFITSNRGAKAIAQLNVLGGTLAGGLGMFNLSVNPIKGANADYFLNRNTGELELTSLLIPNDTLSAGTLATRAFIESSPIDTVNIAVTTGKLWFNVDGSAVIIKHSVTPATPLTFTSSGGANNFRIQMDAGSANFFNNVLVGDWLTFWDASTPVTLRYNSYRVAAVDTAFEWVKFDSQVIYSGGPLSLASAGITFTRTPGQLQEVAVPVATNYTASSLSPLFAAGITGGNSNTYKTKTLRVNTNTFSLDNGDIALVATDTNGSLLTLPVGDAIKNSSGHLGSVESSNSELGTPDFHTATIDNTTTVTWNSNPVLSSDVVNFGYPFEWLRSPPDSSVYTGTRYGNNNGFSTIALNHAGSTVTPRYAPFQPLAGEPIRFAHPYALTPEDSLAILLDGNVDSERYVVPMSRTLKTVGISYGQTNTFKDGDNGNSSLAVGFGFGTNTFDFGDFAVFMAGRVKTHSDGDAVHYLLPPPDLTRTILWRYYKLGKEGEAARLRYVLPSAEDQATPLVSVDEVGNTQDGSSDFYTNINITLASGGIRSGYAVAPANKIGLAITAQAGTHLYKIVTALGFPILSATRTTNVTTVTLDLQGGVTDHGLVAGDTVFINSSNGSFTTAAYSVLASPAPTANTLSYAEIAADAGPAANIGTLSVGTTDSNFTGGSIIVNDFLNLDKSFFTGATANPVMRISAFPNTQTLIGSAESVSAIVGLSTVMVWTVPADPTTAIKIYQNASQPASAIATSITTQALTDLTIPVRPVIIGNGSGVINQSSAEEAGTSPVWFNLADGLNYVSFNTIPGSIGVDYTFTFKNAVNGDLLVDSDWANEVVKAVPITAKNCVDWLRVPTTSGLFSVAEISQSSAGHKVQIASLTPGSAGSVQVQGGTANTVTAAVVGTSFATANGYAGVATIAAADTQGMAGGDFVSVDNAVKLPKPGTFFSTTVITSVTAFGNEWKMLFTTSPLTPADPPASSLVVQVEKQGNFVTIAPTVYGSVPFYPSIKEGDWIRVTAPATPTYIAGEIVLPNTGNTGVFRIVRVEASNTIWIENPAAIEQALTEADIYFYNKDSVLSGDTITINSSILGVGNVGTFTVEDAFTFTNTLVLSGNMAVSGGAALTTAYPFFKVTEGKPSRFVKRILGIVPNPTDGTLADVKFSTAFCIEKIGEVSGSVLTSLDKFNFPTTVANGIDGYQHSTGLIAETNRVVYGDLSNPTTYPGIAAAGTDINISGSLVRRIQVALSIRLKTGVNAQDVIDRVKSAVAAIINKGLIGQPISLSSLTTAAGKIGGVVSAVMVNPVATAGSDLIVLQPYEKPMVLNVDTDVLIFTVGS